MSPWRSSVVKKLPKKKSPQLREQLGLNDPLYVQYGRYLSKALRGDLGVSIRNNQSVSEAIAEQLPSTFALAMSAFIVALRSSAAFLGMLAALRHGSWVDTFVMGLSVSGLSIPTFWMGLLLILFFSVKLKLFPSISSGSSFADLISARPNLGTTRSSRRCAHGARQHAGCAQQGLHRHCSCQGACPKDWSFSNMLCEMR
jgi:peptide/nickel transport system permease protein